jgi:sulfate transport system ATP-binding protein
VLLLDEPFGALDVKIRAQLRQSLKVIQRQLRVATILVTHDQDEAFELADRIAVLERGRLLEVGESEALYTHPRSLAVATFLGVGTVLAGRARAGQLHLEPLAVPIPAELSHEDGQWLALLVRPEHIQLTLAEPDSSESAVLRRGKVVEQSFAGTHRRVRLRLPRPSGVRQLAPSVPGGEEGLLVDALLPVEAPLGGGELWVSLRSWHVLEAPPAKLLVYATPPADGPVVEAAQRLARALGTSITLLGVAENADEVESLRAELERRWTHGALRAEVKVRGGDLARQVALEQQETFCELSVVARADATDRLLEESRFRWRSPSLNAPHAAGSGVVNSWRSRD